MIHGAELNAVINGAELWSCNSQPPNGGEACYLGAVDHGAEKRIQSWVYVVQGCKREFLTKKEPNF